MNAINRVTSSSYSYESSEALYAEYQGLVSYGINKMRGTGMK